ncbi:hypothetical protein D3C85_994760 [compost metagenome]
MPNSIDGAAACDSMLQIIDLAAVSLDERQTLLRRQAFDIFPSTTRQVVDNQHTATGAQESRSEVAADKARATCDEMGAQSIASRPKRVRY